jgi:hypothetical protein
VDVSEGGNGEASTGKADASGENADPNAPAGKADCAPGKDSWYPASTG